MVENGPIFKWFALVSAIVGAMFTAYQYAQSLQHRRIDKALAYLTASRTEMRESRTVFIAEGQSLLKTYMDSSIGLSKEAKIIKWNKLPMEKFESSLEFRNAFWQLLSFYDEVSICAEQELCERDVTYKFFKREASTFLENSAPIICSMRAKVQAKDEFSDLIAAPSVRFFRPKNLPDCSN